jgi:hypothetical protein
MHTAGVTPGATAIAASESSVSVLFDTLFGLSEIVALRLRGGLVRRLF